MKKQSAIKIIIYILYILSGTYTAFGIFKYSYPPTAVRETVTGFLSNFGMDIGVVGSEIIYHFLCLALAVFSVIALFFLLGKGSEKKGMFISGAVVLIFTVLYLLGYLIANKYIHIFAFIGYVISYLTFAVICGRKVFKKSDK